MATNKLIETGRPLPYFCKALDDGRTAFYLDNSTLSSFTTCEQQFKYKYIHLIRGKGRGAAMSLGSWWSTTMELFYKEMDRCQRAKLPLPDKSVVLMLAAKAWTENNMNALEAVQKKAFDKFGGHKGAIQMAGRYFDTYALQDYNNWSIIGVEEGFGLKGEVVIHEDDQIIVYYTGKPDLVVFSKHEDQLMPLDHKTVDKVEYNVQRKYKPHSQTVGYIYAVGILAKELGIQRPVSRCIINVCSRNEPSDKPRDGKIKPRFTRVFPSYSVEEIEEWKQSIALKTKRLYECLLKDEWVWRESACHLYAGCDFRGIDSLAPGSREIAIKADYVQVDPWIPYEVEDGDEED